MATSSPGVLREEAQRLQRNRDDVKVMVRYPLNQRQSVRDLQERIRVRDGDTLREVPLSTVATIKEGRAIQKSGVLMVDAQ